MHWNGTSWSKIVSPNPSSHQNWLNGVSAISPSSAWAVGTFWSGNSTTDTTLVLHWNGTSWSKIASPNPSSTENDLHGVSATSASNAWAVGDYVEGTTGYVTLILHWDGASWSQVASPNPGRENYLSGVSATSASNAWAVGSFYPPNSTLRRTLILHWDGTSWSKVPSPSPSSTKSFLDSVSATSASNAWAVGQYVDNKTGGSGDTLILHWNGSSWSRVASSTHVFLGGVSATSANNAWAVGNDANDDTLILHWNGTTWAAA